jgi:hypothetical protein
MIETHFTSKLTKALRDKLGPTYIAWKHADGYTAGVPDISISIGQRTLWIEAKLSINRKIFEPLQLGYLKKLEGYYVIWNSKERSGVFFSALEAPKKELGYGMSFEALVNKIIEETRKWKT